LLAIIGVAMALAYTYSDWLTPLRNRAADVAYPFYWLTDLPSRVQSWGGEQVKSRSELLAENESLRTELLIHKRELQKMASMAAENVRLRQLLNSADTIKDRVLIAELVGVSPDPMVHTVMVNKGSSDGVYLGQPVLDAEGLMGQVISVGSNASKVLLITDTTHALPVQINRNGVRLVAEGTGNLYQLTLRHVFSTVDIEEGDLLVSSGLGQRFPAGYPVAKVESLHYDPGQPFAQVVARPMAQLNRSRHVLLVFDRPVGFKPPAEMALELEP
jgi:rod shape-determining protein MreC